jgi:hypothetical protein
MTDPNASLGSRRPAAPVSGGIGMVIADSAEALGAVLAAG